MFKRGGRKARASGSIDSFSALDEAISNAQVSAQSENDTDKATVAVAVAVEIEMSRVSLVDPTPDAVQDQPEEKTEPEGYQVCDIETGMCYWVPANKAQPTSAPSSSEATLDQEEKKDEALLNSTPTADTLDTPVASEEPKKDPATLETTAPTLAPALAPALVPRPSSPSRSLSPSRSPRLAPSSTTHDSSPGSTSPGQSSLTPSARVGKLSRDLLALFEKSL